jgi:hypothetical protein
MVNKNVYTDKPRFSDRYSHEQEYIEEFVMGFVNNLEAHNVDRERVMSEVKNIVEDIENLAMEIEKGEYDEPEPDRDECSICKGSNCNC